MNTFYLRIKNGAILIGDRDLYIRNPIGNSFYLVANTLNINEDFGDEVTIFIGTEKDCQKLLDWILKTLNDHYSEQYGLAVDGSYGGMKPLTYLDARNFIQSLEQTKKEDKSSRGFVHPTEGWVSSNCPN